MRMQNMTSHDMSCRSSQQNMTSHDTTLERGSRGPSSGLSAGPQRQGGAAAHDIE